MSADPMESSSPSTPVPVNEPARSPGRLYVFVVTALAIFFFGLVLWRPPIRGYVVSLKLGCNNPTTPANQAGSQADPGAEPAAIKTITDTLVSSRAIRHAVQAANEKTGVAQQAHSDELDLKTVMQLRRRIQVQVEKNTATATLARVHFEGRDPGWSVAFVDDLARQYLASPASAGQPSNSGRESREARWHVDEARHYVRKAWIELESFLQSHFRTSGNINRPLATEADERPPRGGPSHENGFRGGSSGASSNQQKNPEWVQLQSEMASLTTKLNNLLGRYTAEHPEVVNLTFQLEEIRQRLEQTPRLVDNAGNQARGAKPSKLVASLESTMAGAKVEPASPTPDSLQSNTGFSTYVQLLEHFQQALNRRKQAEQAFWQQLDKTDPDDAPTLQNARWVAVPATITRRLGGRPSPGQVLILGMLALLGGALMAWASSTLRGLSRFNTVEDVQRWLPIPVIGQLSLDPVSRSAQRLAGRKTTIRYMTIACELGLAVLLITFVVGTVSSSPASSFFAEDPLGTFAETVMRVCRGPF